MPGAVRKGDMDSGHGPWPPRPCTSGSPDVFVNGIPAHRMGDAWAPHTETVKPYETHSSVAATGSSTVFVNGKPKCRVGDKVACGSVMVGGSSDVIVG